MQPLRWTRVSVSGLALRSSTKGSRNDSDMSSSPRTSRSPNSRSSIQATGSLATTSASNVQREISFRDILGPTYSCEVRLTGSGSQVQNACQKCLVEFISSQFASVDTESTAASFYVKECTMRSLVMAKNSLEILLFQDKGDGWCSFSSSKKPLGSLRIGITQEWLKIGATHQVVRGWLPLRRKRKDDQDGIQGALEMHVCVRLEHEPRYVMEFEGPTRKSPNVTQACGNLRQPAFNSRFRKDNPKKHPKSIFGQPVSHEDDESEIETTMLSCLRGSAVDVKTDGWIFVVYGLSGLPVAVASMSTPFSTTPSSAPTANTTPPKSNRGVWQIMAPLIPGGAMQPWGRLEAWREGNSSKLSCRFSLAQEDFFDTDDTVETIVTSSNLSCRDGGTFTLGSISRRKESSSFRLSAPSSSHSRPTSPSTWSIPATPSTFSRPSSPNPWNRSPVSASSTSTSTISNRNFPYEPPYQQFSTNYLSHTIPASLGMPTTRPARTISLPATNFKVNPSLFRPSSPLTFGDCVPSLPISRTGSISPVRSKAPMTNSTTERPEGAEFTPLPPPSAGNRPSSPLHWFNRLSPRPSSSSSSSQSSGGPPSRNRNRRLRSKSFPWPLLPFPEGSLESGEGPFPEGQDLSWGVGSPTGLPSSNTRFSDGDTQLRRTRSIEGREIFFGGQSGGKRDGVLESETFVMSARLKGSAKGFTARLEVGTRHAQNFDDIGVYVALAGVLELSLDACQPQSRWSRKRP